MSNTNCNILLKICTVCNEEKLIDEFNANKNSKDGHLGQCKKCVKSIRDSNKEKRKEYLNKTKEQRYTSQHSYYLENKEELNARGKEYYLENKEHMNAVNRAWYEANKERCSVQSKVYYEANKECCSARNKAWREANKERCYANARAWSKANKDRKDATRKAWQEANPEKYLAFARNNLRRRRARKRNASGSHTANDVLNLFALQKKKCACCLKSIKSGYHVDHIIPLSRGGSNDKYNLQLLCAHCNCTKSARDPITHNQSLGMLL